MDNNRKARRTYVSDERREHVSFPGKKFYSSNDGFFQFILGMPAFFLKQQQQQQQE